MLATKTGKEAHILGTNHDNKLANKNGLDEIDLWAMGIGQAEKTKSQMTPIRKHIGNYA